MILINSHSLDQSTNLVIDWLLLVGVGYVRLTEKDRVLLRYQGISDNCVFELNNEQFNFKDFKASWYRKGSVRFKTFDLSKTPLELREKVQSFLEDENKVLVDYWFYQLSLVGKPLGNFHKTKRNKLVDLEIAKSCGLDIPNTVITTKQEVIFAMNSKYSIVTKPLSNLFGYVDSDDFYCSYTSVITNENIEKSEITFFPSLLQEKLDKKYELRVFFLNEEFYAMAIFSQNASDTSVDFRNYKDKKQNRTVPYTLPYNIHVCLLKFVKETNLNTGSIDIVVTTDNRFVFLEVNPVGQFGMVSYPCNYHLEKKVATYLSHE